MVDLSKMSYEELVNMKTKINFLMEDYDGHRREKTLQHLDEIARKNGFKSARVVVNGHGDRRRSPVPKKFFNPSNPEMRWSGRGRKPRWFLDALARGITEEEMKIT